MECDQLAAKHDDESDKKYIVRIMCQNKSRFVEFAESELNIVQFPEKGKDLRIFYSCQHFKQQNG